MARYEDRSKEDLLKLATEKDIPGRSSMSKDELVAALRGGKTSETESSAAETQTDGGRTEPGSVVDPNNPDNPTNQDHDPNAEPPEGMTVGEAPAKSRAADPDRVFGPDAVPLEQR